MKQKQTLAIVMVLALMVLPIATAVPVAQFELIGGNSGPIYTETKFAPLVFLNPDSRVLFDDPYGIWSSGNISERNSNYAFVGEQIKWTVLVWDKNGKEKISDVYGALLTQTNGPNGTLNKQVNCRLATPSNFNNRTVLSNVGYPNVRRPNDQTSEVYFNPSTMAIYECVYTVEPGNAQSGTHGQYWYNVEAIDNDNLLGRAVDAESWFFNPSMDISVSGHINFGALGPGEQGSSTISVTNAAENGSGLSVVFYISGTDFYDPTSSGAACPSSNKLALTNFKYSAVQGAAQVSNQAIPYGTAVTSAKKVLGPGTVQTSPGSDMSLTLKLDVPQPCNGQFTDGKINLWAVAV